MVGAIIKRDLIVAAWPSGKAVDCKSSTPSSNLGAACKFLTIVLIIGLYIDIFITILIRECGGMVDTTDLKSVA